MLLAAAPSACTRVGLSPTSDLTPAGDGEPRLDDAAPRDASWPSETSLADQIPAGDTLLPLPLGPFSPPQPIPSLEDQPLASDTSPSLTADLLELYFASDDRPGGYSYGDIWVCTRAHTSAAWGPPQLVTELSSSSREGAVSVSPDGLTLAFASNRPGSFGGAGNWDMWLSIRKDRASAWEPPQPIAELNTAEDELPSTISNDRRLLLFHGTLLGPTNIFSSTRVSADDSWQPPLPIAELNTASFDSHAYLAGDGLDLVFDSDRPGGSGLRDLYLARRAAVGGTFTELVALSELNSEANDAEPWISGDLRLIYFSRSPPGSTSRFSPPFKIYWADR